MDQGFSPSPFPPSARADNNPTEISSNEEHKQVTTRDALVGHPTLGRGAEDSSCAIFWNLPDPTRAIF